MAQGTQFREVVSKEVTVTEGPDQFCPQIYLKIIENLWKYHNPTPQPICQIIPQIFPLAMVLQVNQPTIIQQSTHQIAQWKLTNFQTRRKKVSQKEISLRIFGHNLVFPA